MNKKKEIEIKASENEQPNPFLCLVQTKIITTPQTKQHDFILE